MTNGFIDLSHAIVLQRFYYLYSVKQGTGVAGSSQCRPVANRITYPIDFAGSLILEENVILTFA